MANRMSLFYAEATPMLKTLSNATTKFVSEVSGAGGALRGQKAQSSGAEPPLLLRLHAGTRLGWGAGMCPPGSWEGDSPWVLPCCRTRPSRSRTRPTA